MMPLSHSAFTQAVSAINVSRDSNVEETISAEIAAYVFSISQYYNAHKLFKRHGLLSQKVSVRTYFSQK